jgi:hypothetical protein
MRRDSFHAATPLQEASLNILCVIAYQFDCPSRMHYGREHGHYELVPLFSYSDHESVAEFSVLVGFMHLTKRDVLKPT